MLFDGRLISVNQCNYFSIRQSTDWFHMANDENKREHSENLSVLLYIAHLLPFACMSNYILGYIFLPEDLTKSWGNLRKFHANFPLNGWNDHIVQPARDAVLDYYKVRTPYLTCAVLALTIKRYLFSESALRKAIRRRGVHAPQ